MTSGDESTEEPVTFKSWDDVVTYARANISGGLEKYQVPSDVPIYASLVPHIIGTDLKIDKTPYEENLEEAQPGVPSAYYYRLPHHELIALSACADKECTVLNFQKRERRPPRRPKQEDARQRHGDSHDEGRHHGNLVPFEPQLLPIHIPGGDEPIEQYPRRGNGHDQRIAPPPFPKQSFYSGEQGHHRDGYDMHPGPRPGLSEAQQQLITQGLKARSGVSSTRWMNPKATDGIFSLGSLKGDSPREGAAGGGALTSLGQMIQNLHLKKHGAVKEHGDVMNISTRDVSNFTFVDDESSSSLKSSQFSKFFRKSDSRNNEGTSTFPHGTDSSTRPVNVDDAKNRERASQLFQQMVERKS
ncbi:hypothetical protein BBOV_III007910 [Babesia bovis T2Bo]|uniref:Uncharacterized protein n=1 Tax=Babesia bovis TaxID=5865 RepID=A7AP67_BABBO|nr:hypothetical protein BBOV_III007910 [Babesia bovis T2Bo]EDO08351.1 hypothetical protein BBOV_III007910 [Babesia bovis T2Bo]BAN66259.1 hypothetical protein [Babesia bovis]|eukprot:XP_001611919.1 hypothetical protein [Babesia bovis T2Bo]